MSLFLFSVALIAMLAVVAVLFAGIVSMARGGEFNARWGNRLMRWRITLQAVAIVALLLVVWAVKSHH
ncbi:MAG TPA: twin transmembrane helix small protein [Asticcacaulis sp.]|nr:twin transmembrane helix small protein [Asticcacaulis sp.]